MDIDALPGLRETLQTDFVCSNYLDPRKTYRLLKISKAATRFSPNLPPHPLWRPPEDHVHGRRVPSRKHGLRENECPLRHAGFGHFGVKEFADTLNNIIRSRKIIFKPFMLPYGSILSKREIIFKYVNPERGDRSNSLNGNLGESLNDQGRSGDEIRLSPPGSATEAAPTLSVLSVCLPGRTEQRLDGSRHPHASTSPLPERLRRRRCRSTSHRQRPGSHPQTGPGGRGQYHSP